MTMDQLPKCLFREGTETQVEKVNNTCRTSILKKVEKYVEAEYNDVLGDPLFAQVIAIYVHKLKYSGRVIHSFVCKQLLTAKRHELWFHFARRPLRFAMQEFHAITGLKYIDDDLDLEIDNWKDDKGFWSKLLRRKEKICLLDIRKKHLKACNTWSRIDRLRIVYLCVIVGLLMAKDERVAIPHKYIKLVMDFEKMRRYPWGLHSFDALVTSIIAARDKVKTQNSYVIDGFSYALQIWLMEAIPDIGSLVGKKLEEGVTSMRCSNWKGSAMVSYDDITSIESNFPSTGDVFPYISSTGNCNIIVDAGFERQDEMKDERVDLIIDMYRQKYDWSKHVWSFQETVQPYACISEDDGSKEEEAGETSDSRVEEEIEAAHVSPAKKRKNQYQDIGAQSRKKKLLCQRSADKYKDLEEEMKSYIQDMFKSSFTALGLEVRELIDDRFTKLEEKILSSQPQVGVPVGVPSGLPAYTHTPAAATTSSGPPVRGYIPTPASTDPAPGSAPPTAPVTSRSRASAPSRNKAPVSSQTGGPATAAKTRYQTKDADLSDVYGSLFSSLDENLGTQEHLQKTVGNLTQESNVKGFDPSQDKQSEDHDAFTTPLTSFRPQNSKSPFLTDIDDPIVRCKDSDYALVINIVTIMLLLYRAIQIGPSKFDAELATRIIGPNHWLKNYDMDAMMYLFQERTSLRRWKPTRVAFMSCLFSTQIISAFGRFDGNRRSYKIDKNLLEYGRGELPYHGRTDAVWNVDVDRLYIPVFVNQNHWISMCVNLVNRTIEVFDCGGRKNNRSVEAFAVLIPRIVKAVQPPDKKKDFNVKQYTVSHVPISGVNKSGNDCGAYSLKFIECHLLGLDFTLVNDENIQEARHKIAYDLWEAAHDEVLQFRMATFKPPLRAPEKVVDLG
ncbi:uncharacterized protein LOC108836669 [Raphanus sativus]|uniref:Uncharacterized protein LOC108836669 n=1 Tax=Raphanus sativus TaxID=3726 RepID=A0A6J0LZU0_RAPSA|nr:uncharacterized protein LOC108836669 [Raphanus sativus]